MVYQIDTLHLLLDGFGCDEKKLRDMELWFGDDLC